MKKTVNSNSPFEDLIGFSRACRIEDSIAVSGTAPISDEGKTVGLGDVYKQTLRCLELSQTAIEQAGGKLENVIRTRIMLTDISRWEEAAKAHAEYFRGIKPACTFVEVKGFINPEWLVETEIDCKILSPD